MSSGALAGMTVNHDITPRGPHRHLARGRRETLPGRVRSRTRAQARGHRHEQGIARMPAQWQGVLMAERTPSLHALYATLWRGGIGDGAEARRASSLHVAIFLLWPLAAIAGGLVSLLLAWFGRSVAQVGFLVTFGAGLVLPFAWQWWERSLWRARRRAARAMRFLPLYDLADLATLEDGEPVRVRGRVRARDAFTAAGAAPDAPADAVYEQVETRPDTFGDAVWYELGCDFELVDDAGQSALVRLAGAQVFPLRMRRVTVRGHDAVLRVLARVPVDRDGATMMRNRRHARLSARMHAIRTGDEIEIMACKLPPDGQAVLPRESALRPVIGAHHGIAPLAPVVIVLAERAA
jgi:hypothetical protein